MADALREAVRARAAASLLPPEVRGAAAEIARLGGESVQGVLFFGSRKTRPSDDPWSAHDFFVLTEGYRAFYASLRAHASLRRSPALVAALNAWLPPNQVSLQPSVLGRPLLAKCAVVSMPVLLRETGEGRRDHFCAGRLFQPVGVAFARDDAAAEQVLDALTSAHRVTYAWARPFLPDEFDAAGYARTLLSVSMDAELRPEPAGRADALFESQREYHAAVYPALLGELLERGELVARSAGRYALARPAGAWERARLRTFFRWSLLRATARWAKYVITFDDWLEYILRKTQRHTGKEILLSERARRWPLLLAWPHVLRYFRDKDRR